MSDQQQPCISDGEDDGGEHIDQPAIAIVNDAVIRKNLFDEFDVPSKQKAPSDNSGREYMRVYLRVRPFSNEEIEAKEDQNCVEKESNTSVLMNAPKESFAFKNSTRAGGDVSHRFTFSNVFSEDTSQKMFFDETTLPLVTDFIHGQNCLVFTYGVTNSGKTYTIQGSPKDGGVLPRSLDVLFNSIQGKQYNRMNLKPRFCSDVTRLEDEAEQKEQAFKNALLSTLNKETFDINAFLKLEPDSFGEQDISKANSCVDESSLHNTLKSHDGEHEEQSIDAEEDVSRIADDTTINVDAQGPVKFAVWVSFAEIYNEVIYDLLEPCPMGKGKKRTTLRLGDDTNGNPYVKGLREIHVSNADEAYKILKIGQKNQRIASTKLNQCSSRSHCIFNVKVLRVVDVADPHVARVSRLSFVDLAGSERYSKTQSKGDRLKEAGNINTSLMTLGKCLEYLRHNQRNPSQPLIIPFRESKLTRLFQGFFCGRGRASMIVNVNMCASMFDETFHVLKFSAIAKKVTTRVTKPVDIPLPCKKPRITAPKQTRLSVPWANGGFRTPAPVSNSPLVEEEEEGEDEVMDEGNCYQQELVNLVKVLQEKLIEEKRKVQTLEVKIREEVCGEMAEQLVAIETAYSERVKMEVTAVEEKCDRRIELLTQSIKKTRKRARIERVEEDEEEWVPSVFLHAEKVKVQEKEHLIKNLNAKVAELRQEVKQLQDSRKEEVDKSSVVLELQTHLNDANEQVAELKQMLEEAGEAFTDKEAEIQKLKAALDEEETCSKKQDAALQQLTVQLEEAKPAPKERADPDELARANVALEAAMAKLADTENNLAMKDSMMIELVRTLEETREELAREKSYVVQAFDNDEEIIRLKDELQTAETKKVALEKDLSSKEETIETLRKLAEEAKAEALERTSQISDDEMARLKGELQAAEAKMAAMEKDVSSKVETIQSLKKMVEDTKAEALEKAAQMTEKELEVEQARVKEMEDVKDDSVEKTTNDDAVKELERQLEESTKALDKKNSQVITKNNAIRRLELSLAEKERLLSDMEKLPKEPNLRAKEELKTLRRRVMQTDKEAKELMSAKEDAQNELAASKNELQQTKTSLEELKAEVVKREETFQSLQGQLESQRLQIAALQTELDSEKNDLLEKEKEVQEAKEELIVLRKTEPELAEMRELLASAKSRVKDLEEEVQRAKGELVVERKTSDSELAEVKELRISAEKKVQELEEEVFSANEKMSQCQDDVQRYQNNLVPELKAKVKDLEQELARSGDTLKDAEMKLETNGRESRAQLDKWIKDMEQKTKEVSDLREALKTLDQEKCQELDKVWQELVSMQKTIEERNKTIDDLENKLRVTGREQDSSKEQMQTLSAKLNSALQENTALEGRMEAMTKHMDLLKSDAGKEKDVSVNLKQLREEQDRVMAEQAQALDERQTELETLSTELQTWQDKCSLTCKELERKKEEILNLHKQVSVASDEKKQLITKVNAMSSQQHATESDAKSQLGRIEGEVEKLNSERSALEEQVRRKDEEIRKVNESKDDIMKTMREAFDVAKAKKAEYEVKLATVREQCRKEMKREMDEELRRAKRDYQRQLEEKDRSLEEMNSKKEAVVVESEERTSIDVPVTGDNKQAQDSRASASLTKSTAKKNLKRNSSDLSLAEVKKRMEEGSKLRKEESDGEFTPGSVRKSQRARSSTKKVVRTNSCRSKQKPTPAKVTVLSTMEENETARDDKVTEKRKLFSDIKESHSSSGEEKETTKSSAQANEETENVPPSKAPSTTKKRRGKLFQKAIGVGSFLSPAKSVSKETKSEQDSVAAIITRQLRPRTIKYN